MDQKQKDYVTVRETMLKEELKDLHIRHSRRYRLFRLYLITGIFILAASPIVYFGFKMKLASLITFGYGALIVLLPLAVPLSDLEIQIRDIENEIDLLGVTVSPVEQRAEKLFKSHQLELKKYYDQTLRHSAWIFVAGIVCIVLGFGVIGWALYAVQTSASESGIFEKIVLGTLGAVAGILANFIAVIYLKMYSETVKSLTEFHNRLVTTNHLHFANFLTAKITDETLKQKTLADIAESLSRSQKA